MSVDGKNGLPYSYWMGDDVIPDTLFKYDAASPVQEFLESRKCFLSQYKMDGGILFSQWLASYCCTYDVNTKLILATLQKEQSLISLKAEPDKRIMDRAMGFGMTDAGDMAEYYGFEQQVANSIQWFRKQYDLAAAKLKSDSLLSVLVDEGFIKVNTVSIFTYISYKYTPWTGVPGSLFSRKHGRNHGVYLFWLIWKMYWPKDLDATRTSLPDFFA